LILNTLSDKYNSVLIVGHNPTVEDTIQMVTDSGGVVTIPSCVLAHLSLPIEKWSDLSKSGTTYCSVKGNNTTQIGFCVILLF
jgi:phosphohistidine phosphatase